MNNTVFIIAEAGVNHNGNDDMAFRLVDTAVEAGADAVKFQTFKAENLVTKAASKAEYQKETTDSTESQFVMLKRLELSHDTHHKLYSYCKEKGIQFLSTAFDLDSLLFLVHDLGLRTLKIPSGEITNGPLLLEHARTGCQLILSTGMATLDEVKMALSVIAFGLTCDQSPSMKAFDTAYNTKEGQEALKEKVILLHCTTEYPAPLQDINLNAMSTMSDVFGLRTGYSDHSEGIIVPTAAVALGATLIEKHFTMDKSLPGPDHKASLEPEELKVMVSAIRIVEQVMGDGIKSPRPSEIANRGVARKSLVAATDIAQGEVFTKENIAIKRPGMGTSPMKYWDFLGDHAWKELSEDEGIG